LRRKWGEENIYLMLMWVIACNFMFYSYDYFGINIGELAVIRKKNGGSVVLSAVCCV
jgi:hypothetical protein